MIIQVDPYASKTASEEEQIYAHLLHCVQHEPPSQVIERFRMLFINGLRYNDPPVLAALDKIAAAPTAEQTFRLFLNRCCHILINRWQTRPQTQAAIPEFVALFGKPGSSTAAGLGRSRSVRRLRELVQQFIKSEQYETLRRLAEFMTVAEEPNLDPQQPAAADASPTQLIGLSSVVPPEAVAEKPLVSLIRRYPFLYDNCLLNEDSPAEQQQLIRTVQTQVQKQFEGDLFNYLTYQVRRARSSDKLIQPVKNPTLLGNGELCLALKQFVGKAEGNSTYRELAQRFEVYTKQTDSFRTFKNDFYEYLVSSVDTKYGNCRFNNQLHQYLTNIASQGNSQKLSDFLLVRACSQILNFLVVESSQNPQHFVFVDLVTNIGATATAGLLLKIVLICKKVKPYLEKRFAILFNHYKSYSRAGVQWLINFLENLNVAWATHFGAVDYSLVNHIVPVSGR